MEIMVAVIFNNNMIGLKKMVLIFLTIRRYQLMKLHRLQS